MTDKQLSGYLTEKPIWNAIKSNINKDNYIISYGFPRSGSTLLWNILKDVLKTKVIVKSHHYNYLMKNMLIIGSYRDIRDSLLSYWKVNTRREIMSLEDFKDTKLEKHWDKLIYTLIKLKSMSQKNNNVYLIKYEVFYNDFDKIFDLIEEVFELKIPNKTKDEIKIKYSLNNVKKLIEKKKLNTFKQVDKNTKFHGNHINNGSIDDYKLYMKKELQEYLYKKYQNKLKILGYE